MHQGSMRAPLNWREAGKGVGAGLRPVGLDRHGQTEVGQVVYVKVRPASLYTLKTFSMALT